LRNDFRTRDRSARDRRRRPRRRLFGAVAGRLHAVAADRAAARLRADSRLRSGLLHHLLRAGDRRRALMLVLITILLPIVAGALLWLLPREDRVLSRAIGTLVAAVTFVTTVFANSQAQEWSYRWLSRPFVSSFHFGTTPVSYWICLLLALCTMSAIAVTQLPRTRNF